MGRALDMGIIDSPCTIWKLHSLKSSHHFWNFSYGNHPMADPSVNCLTDLLSHAPDSGLSSPKVICNGRVAIWCCQLPQSNSHPLLHQYGFPQSSVLILEVWCKFLTWLHEDLFPHSGVLKPPLAIPVFGNDVIPPRLYQFFTGSGSPPKGIPWQYRHLPYLYHVS